MTTGDDGATAEVDLDDGTTAPADRVLVATGRRPATAGIGLQQLGIHVEGGHGIPVDARCRVAGAPGVFAVGDVTGIAPFTHTATYQGRLVAAELLGHGRDGDFSALPRAVYTEPAVFSVGLTETAAHEADRDVRVTRYDVTGTARAFLERSASDRETGPAGLALVADARTGVLLGATVVGPVADAWGGELALAVRLGVDVATLEDVVHAFPTWSEAIQPAAAALT